MGELAEKVQRELIEAIDNDELILPTLPEAALEVREAARDPEISIGALARVIGHDAALSARLIKVANNPLMRANREITDLQTAISRLGINYTCTLATGLAMEQMFQATSPVVDRKMREVWRKSSEVAGICYMLCRHYTRLVPDQATLAGLVSRIGVLPILTYAETHDELLADPAVLDQIIEQTHPSLGDRILRSWEFPVSITGVPGEYLNFARDSAQVDYVDIVQVAELLSHVGTEHPFTRLDWRGIAAFAKLGLDPDLDVQADEDLSDSMEAAMGMLQ
ncbi:HDOD domain-containing protein [Azotobacter chroococcum]|uniref:HDOD domain-containing protein n=1 Tax=Azotobacter chroococcum TaxID=353 RepID=UPI000B5ECA16|nr:HDOD domain-containing protein [Azotobacter chroococcum]ASL26650.1 histidine kinase [Azotobacter chroococcum]TBW32535.1 HDOD domain-containing protein [Azotobacter chroococcum]